MSKRRNNLDERQEQKLLKIGYNGFWLAFWGLIGLIIIQVIFGGEDTLGRITGEEIVLLCICIYMVSACIKNGIWDKKLQPNLKTNILASLIAGGAMGVVYFFSSYLKYEKLIGSIATGIFIGIFIFFLVLGTLTIAGEIYKKRVKKLETEETDEEKPDQL